MKLTHPTLRSVAILLFGAAITVSAQTITIDGGMTETFDGISTNGAALEVGRDDPNNTLIITNAAAVTVKDAYLGLRAASTNNTLLVTGTGSILHATNTFTIGSAGDDNQVTVSDSGLIIVGNSDTGSVSLAAGGIVVGDTTGEAELTAENGTSIEADMFYLGTGTNDLGTVTLSGTDTMINISSNFYLGYAGTSNEVNISGAAVLAVSNNLVVGSTNGSFNTLNINNDGTVFIGGAEIVNGGSASNNAINVNQGGRLQWGGDADIQNAEDNGFNFAKGSTIEIGGELSTDAIDGGYQVILNGNLSSNTAAWNPAQMFVGENEGGNTLTIENGATVTAGGTKAYIGDAGTSSGNIVNVDGTNSQLTVNGTLVVGNDGNNNQLKIEDGAVDTGADLIIGNSGRGNSLTINTSSNASPASLTVGGDLVLGMNGGATGNQITLSGSNSLASVGGNLTVGNNGNGNEVTLNSETTMQVAGDTFIGFNSDDNSIALSGSNATLAVTGSFNIGEDGDNNFLLLTGSNVLATVGGDLQVGQNGSQNELTIEESASFALTGNAFLGSNSSNNTILVTGSNSVLNIGGNFLLGNISVTNSFTNNTFNVFEQALATIGGNMDIGNGSFVNIDVGSQLVVDGDYTQDETSELSMRVGISSMDITNLVVAGSASFASNTTINVFDDGTAGNTNEFEQTILASSGLWIAGTNATTELLNNTNVINFVNNLLDIDATVVDETILLKTRFVHMADAYALNGTSLEPVANEIDGMALDGNELAVGMRNLMGVTLNLSTAQGNQAMQNFYGEKESSIPVNNVINQGISGLASELTLRGDNTRERMGAASASLNWDRPTGAAGPHSKDQELQGWVAGYGTWGSKDSDGGYGSYDSDLSGFIIGADLTVSENILMGVAGGANSGSLDGDNGKDADTDTTYGAIYASLGSTDWFLDGSIIYASSEVDQEQGDLFDTKASYDSMNMAFYLGGGKEIIGDYLIITPQASLLVNYYDQDDYKEKSTMAVPRTVDGFDDVYVQSSIGCNVGAYMGMGDITFKPELRAHWLHEFNADDQSLSYGLIGGVGSPYTMKLQAPEEDILLLGAGISAKMSDFVELRFDVDTRQADGYSDYTVLGSLRYQF